EGGGRRKYPAPQAGRPASAREFWSGGRGVPRRGADPSHGFARLIATCCQNQGKAMAVTLHVCITCRAGQTIPEGQPTPGSRLHKAVVELGAPEGVNIVPVECLSACNNGCSVALSAPGRW